MDAESGKLIGELGKLPGFESTARGIVLGVEIQYHGCPVPEGGKADRLAVLIFQRKIGRGIIDVQHGNLLY
jgi:hypothetical protein